jgi:hypothetical protein
VKSASLTSIVLSLSLFLAFPSRAADAPVHEIPGNRVASVLISEDFLNEQIGLHVKSEYVKDVKLALDPERDQILIRGVVQVPTEELRAINLDKKQGTFRFQVSAKLATTKHGHLIIEFPLNETFFYPVDSKDPERERVIVPVQMLSIALASARGYLAAIAGDFGGFDRRTAKLEALLKSLDHSIATEKNKDLRDDLKTQREALKIQLSAIPLERKQLEGLSKEYASILGFTGEKEINLNDELAARKNALVLKLKLSQLVPYLNGVDLGGIRIRHDKKDGNGENYFIVDVDSQLDVPAPPAIKTTPSDRPPLKIPPSLIIRMNQSLFESQALVDMEKKEMGSKIHDLKLELQEDGLHVSGSAKVFLFISVGFGTVVDFVTTGTDEFEVRVREIKVAGIDFDFMAKTILESMKRRLNHSLGGICKFQYVGEEDHSHALRVMVDPKALVPAFPDLHLVNVDVRTGAFLMKVGRI